MTTRPRGPLLGFLTCGALLLLHAWKTEACTMPIGPSVLAQGSSVPANGVIGVESRCTTACEDFGPPTTLMVADEQGQPIAGSFVDSGATAIGYWSVWRPDQALTPGSTISVYQRQGLVPGFPSGDKTFPVTEPQPIDLTSVALTLNTTLTFARHGESKCCVSAPGNSCDSAPTCWSDEDIASVLVTRDFNPSPELMGQVLYRVTWFAAGNPTLQDDWGFLPPYSHTFDVEAPEYCASITVEQLATGEVTELAPTCIPHGDLGPLGIVAVSKEQKEQVLAQCYVPPPEYHADWCALADRVDGCSSDACMEAKAMCPALLLSDASNPNSTDATNGVDEPSAGCAVRARRDGGAVTWLVGVAFLVRRVRGSRRVRYRGRPPNH